MTLERRDRFIRIVHEKGSGLVLGIQETGVGVSEMAGESTMALEMAATLTYIAETIHAHPKLGESVQEAAKTHLAVAIGREVIVAGYTRP